MLVNQYETKSPAVEIQYSRAVKPEGNIKALEMLDEVFLMRDDWWRGLGILANSGLGINEKYASFDAEKQFEVEVEILKEDKGCICGTILKGISKPSDCKLFGKACTPAEPVGACMVSNEGACAAHYKYSRE
jgi:hydrogenase expression/formation protein HypD